MADFPSGRDNSALTGTSMNNRMAVLTKQTKPLELPRQIIIPDKIVIIDEHPEPVTEM